MDKPSMIEITSEMSLSDNKLILLKFTLLFRKQVLIPRPT